MIHALSWPALLLTTLVATTACGPKAPPAVVLSEPSDLDETALNALVAELAPLVEQAAGVEFEVIPHARLGRRADLETLLEAETELVVGEMYEAPDWVLRQLARRSRGSAPAVLGKYGIETRVLYLSPDAITAAVAHSELSSERFGDAARLILAHEMAHALQDQHADTGARFRRLDDLDAMQGLRAVTEGHANLVERRVAEQLGLQDVQRALDATQGWDESGPLHPGAFELWAIYGQGLSFVSHHHREGGNERVWEVVRHPPPSSTMIFRPETYAVALPPAPDHKEELAGVEDALSEGSWVALHSRLGEYALRSETQGAAFDDCAEPLDALRYAFVREVFQDDRNATVRVMAFDSPEAATSWRQALDCQDAALARAEPPVQVERGSLELQGTDWVEHRVVLAVGPSGASMVGGEQHQVWFARGPLVYAIHAKGFRPGRRLQAASERLVAQIEEHPP